MADKADRYVTSEEKLLKLIRHKDQSQKQRAGKDAKAISIKGTPFAAGALADDWLTILNKVLMAAVAGLAVYLIVKAVFLSSTMTTRTIVADQAVPADQAAVEPQPQPLDYYLGIVEKRDMFDASFGPTVTSQKTDSKAEPVSADDPRQALRLVGIVMDSNPQVIIEDLKSHETYFVSQGQQVNKFTVSDIREEKVTLTYNGQSYELSNE